MCKLKNFFIHRHLQVGVATEPVYFQDMTDCPLRIHRLLDSAMSINKWEGWHSTAPLWCTVSNSAVMSNVRVTRSTLPEAPAGGFLRWRYSLRAAQFVPGLVIFHWLLLQSHRLQVRRVDVLQTEQTAPLGVKRAKGCPNIDICEILSPFKTSLMPCSGQELNYIFFIP